MPATPFERWARLFRAASEPVLAAEPALTPLTIAGFSDEAGHRRDTDAPFLHVLARLPFAGAMPATASLDVRLWVCLANNSSPREITSHGNGPLLCQQSVSLEVYTERLLCAMHAAHRLALACRRPDWWRRTAESAAWFTRELQPDNATNHPWAIGVFAALACETNPTAPESTDAGLVAQTLLSNCQVMHGRASRLSAYILDDSAGALLAHAQAGW